MHECLEDSIDAGLRDTRFLKDIFEREGCVILLKQLNDVERLGKNWNQVEPLDFCFGQLIFSVATV
jgi:hypothetical protein